MTLAPACTEPACPLRGALGSQGTHKQRHFLFHWSSLTDPETEPVTHHSMNLHIVFCSVHFSNHSNQISIQSCTRAECIPFSPLMERQGTRIEFLLLDVCSSGFEIKILQSFWWLSISLKSKDINRHLLQSMCTVYFCYCYWPRWSLYYLQQLAFLSRHVYYCHIHI